MHRLLPVFMIAVCAGCMDPASAEPNSTSESSESSEIRGHENPNPALYDKDARPYGLSQVTWSELLWDYIYAQPADVNPFFDGTGQDCAVGQFGPVWFLPSVPGASLGTEVTRSCTIPRNHSVILQLASAINDFPCPDPTFKPAPGQSLYDFLIGPVLPIIDSVTGFDVAIDGVAIADPLSYRDTSQHVFPIRGDLSMQTAFDNCITGKLQPMVSDGYYLMFKPLAPGPHTIVVHGQDGEGTHITLTENLTVR